MREPDPTASAAHLRNELRRRRASVDPLDLATRSSAAMTRVEGLPWWSAVGRLAVYRPFDGELDPAALASSARARGIDTFVPVLAGERLRFASFDDSTAWRRNTYGIDEPVESHTVDADALDLVLVPAVAVDPHGNRVGMGAGWYDRTFAWLRGVDRPADVVLVSAVGDEQVVERITPAEWDVTVDAIVTPSRTLLAARRVVD